jgi:rhodanese-related sulfurtransferase
MDWTITPHELKKEMSKIVLVDVREEEEREESKIDGSKHIPLGEITIRAIKELNPTDDIVLYCAHGVRSLHALVALRQLGFEKLRSLEGGICAWQESGF